MLRPLQLPDKYSGKLLLASMLGRFETLEKILGWCKAGYVDEIVYLVGGKEIAEITDNYLVAFVNTFAVIRF